MFIRFINGVMNLAGFIILLVILLFVGGKQNAIGLLFFMFFLAGFVFAFKGEVGSALVSFLVSVFLYSFFEKNRK